jgi:hypothetical protein
MTRDRPLLIKSIVMIFAIVVSMGWLFLQRDRAAQQANSSIALRNDSSVQTDDPAYLAVTGLVQLVPPVVTTSYYLRSMNSLNGLGHALGVNDALMPGKQDHLIILDYGYPRWRQLQGGAYEYGIQLVDDPQKAFQNMTSVINSAVEFATQYFVTVHSSDPNSHLRIVMGVNNCCWGLDYNRFSGHGAAWAATVQSIKNQISGYSSEVDVRAGMDIEQSYLDGGGDPYNTRVWLDAYMNQSDCIPGDPSSADACFYNFGTMQISDWGTICNTAPGFLANNAEPSTLENIAATPTPPPPLLWHACDVWYLSWGAKKGGSHFARPLPEIYHSVNSSPP